MIDLSSNTLIILISGIMSFFALQKPRLFDRLKHYPYIESNQGQYGRLLTSGFIHGSYLHLIINMFVLNEFGPIVESMFVEKLGTLGSLIYFLAYVSTLVLADIPTFLKHKNNPSFASIGASGAVSGVVFFYCLQYPWNMLGLMLIIPIPAILFAFLFLAYSLYGNNQLKHHIRIDHSAHFYGAIIFVILALFIHPQLMLDFPNKFLDGWTNIGSR